MSSVCVQCVVENMRKEMWSYIALTGIMLLQGGIVLLVYALKRATTSPELAQALGLALILLGLMATIVSWCAHRLRRQKKKFRCRDVMCCSRRRREVDSEEVPFVSRGAEHEQISTLTKYSTPEFQVNRFRYQSF